MASVKVNILSVGAERKVSQSLDSLKYRSSVTDALVLCDDAGTD